MQTDELKSKLQEMITLTEEVIPELGPQTNEGVLLQQAYTQMIQVQRTVKSVYNTVTETEGLAKEQKKRDVPEEKLPKKAASPASKVDKGGS